MLTARLLQVLRDLTGEEIIEDSADTDPDSPDYVDDGLVAPQSDRGRSLQPAISDSPAPQPDAKTPPNNPPAPESANIPPDTPRTVQTTSVSTSSKPYSTEHNVNIKINLEAALDDFVKKFFMPRGTSGASSPFGGCPGGSMFVCIMEGCSGSGVAIQAFSACVATCATRCAV